MDGGAWWATVLRVAKSQTRLFATPWTVAYQAPPSMGFSRPECWSGFSFPSPGDFPYTTLFRSLGWEDLLEEEMATRSSTLAWKIPWTEEPGRLQSMEVAKSWT